MLKVALHRNRVDILVSRPPEIPFLKQLFQLWRGHRHPKRGLRAPGSRTFVSLSFTQEKRGLTPLVLSADHRRLLSYTARFQNGDVALLIIAGRSVSSICSDGVLRNALTALHLETAIRGPVTEHRITEVLPKRTPIEALASRLSFLAVKAFIMHPWDDGCDELPPLNHTQLYLEGLSCKAEGAPTCTFKSSRGNFDVLVKVAWGRRSRESETVNVTTPLASLAQAS
jgi:hypothetical protein